MRCGTAFQLRPGDLGMGSMSATGHAAAFKVEHLCSHHDLDGFRSGDAVLDTAAKNMKRQFEIFQLDRHTVLPVYVT